MTDSNFKVEPIRGHARQTSSVCRWGLRASGRARNLPSSESVNSHGNRLAVALGTRSLTRRTQRRNERQARAAASTHPELVDGRPLLTVTGGPYVGEGSGRQPITARAASNQGDRVRVGLHAETSTVCGMLSVCPKHRLLHSGWWLERRSSPSPLDD